MTLDLGHLEGFSGAVELTVDKNGAVRQAGADRAGAFVADIKRSAERSLYFFGKVIMGYDLLSPVLHLPECDRLQATPPYRKLTLFPRGHLKTTILKALCVHQIIQSGAALGDGTFDNVYFPHGIVGTPAPVGTDIRILLASKTSGLAMSTLAEIMMNVEANELLPALWPGCFWENTKDARWWNQERIVFPRRATHKEATIETIGVGGQITGYHFNVQIFDDLIDIQTANSAVEMFKTIEWWKASRALMHDQARSLEFIVGTRWAVNDLYDWIMKNDPSVDPRVRAVIEDGVPIFPEMFTLDSIAQMQRELQSLFPLLYMNSATDRSLTDFDMTRVRDFFISDGQLCFEETVDDAMLVDRRATAKALREDAVVHATERRESRRIKLDGDGFDQLAARNQYLRVARTRSE
jgi:hypothetical protein